MSHERSRFDQNDHFRRRSFYDDNFQGEDIKHVTFEDGDVCLWAVKLLSTVHEAGIIINVLMRPEI
jgi:ectoine hydroxylase-related dioxygenase (phytanoyl-CoA dioxygenase family)